MKTTLLFLLLVALLSCKKEVPTTIPDGYYDYQIIYEGGYYTENGNM